MPRKPSTIAVRVERAAIRASSAAGKDWLCFSFRQAIESDYNTPIMTGLRYRPDIDGLRAVAVLSVVSYHAFPAVLPGGFVGVDVFFVISGFLITSIIFSSLNSETFSFKEFYARRIARIFPALLVVLAFCYAVGWVLLLPDEYGQLGKHIVAGSAFISNLVFLRESGYFDAVGETKPLLHLWSLGIEEQFYLVWPLIAVAARRIRIKPFFLTIALAALSFLMNIHIVQQNVVYAFYSPFSRAWELMLGAVLATASISNNQRSVSAWLRESLAILGLALIVGSVMLVKKGDRFPGWWALLPTAGTLCLIHAGSAARISRKLLSHPVLVFVGLISYPLYLWHWPLLSFVRITEAGPPTVLLRIVVVVIAVGLAWMTYSLLEGPIRSGADRMKKALYLGGLMAVCGCLGITSYRHGGLPFREIARLNHDITEARRWDFWKDPVCVRTYGTEPCVSNSSRATVMLLGDSHANHLYAGLASSPSPLKVINIGTCLPLDSVIVGVTKNQARHPCTDRDTFAFDTKVLAANPSVTAVVIAAWWRPYLEGGVDTPKFRDQWGEITLAPQLPQEVGMSRSDLMFHGLSRAISYFESKKLRIVLVLDTPDVDSDLREYCGFGSRLRSYSDCSVPRAMVARRRDKEMILTRRLKDVYPGLIVFDPLEYVCDADRCYFLRDGQLLFRDEHHLSVEGSQLLASHLIPLLEPHAAPVQVERASASQ
jgi:peptidoglycan/LPS O-acetylase OafA/YrhL